MNTNISSTLACTVSNNTSTMNYNGSAQKVAFTFNPKQSFDLKYDADTSLTTDSFKVE